MQKLFWCLFYIDLFFSTLQVSSLSFSYFELKSHSHSTFIPHLVISGLNLCKRASFKSIQVY